MRWAWVLLLLVPAAQACPTATDSVAVSVNQGAFGEPGTSGDCFLLDTAQVASAGAHNFDLRLTSCFGKPYGTELTDSDVTERSAAYAQVASSLVFGDADNNGRYNPGDPVFVRSGTGTGFPAGAWALRLTGPAAGSFVQAGDADHLAYGSTAAAWAQASLAWCDFDGSVTYTPGDAAYLMPVAPGTAAGTLVMLGSLRIAPAQSASTTSSPPASSSTSATASSSTSAQPAATTDSPATTAPADDSDDPGSSKTPGLGLAGMLAVVGAALELVRRKL